MFENPGGPRPPLPTPIYASCYLGAVTTRGTHGRHGSGCYNIAIMSLCTCIDFNSLLFLW